jgi:hypothetical protein
MAGVTITRGTATSVHDTVFAATENDTLYAMDAHTGAGLWSRSLRTAGLPGVDLITAVPSGDTHSSVLVPTIGVTGTPVIDASNGFIYALASTKQFLRGDPRPRWVFTLFKITIGNGAIAASHIIAATYIDKHGFEFRTADDPSAAQDPFVYGDGDGSITVNGQTRVYFNALREFNRTGAVLYNGTVFLAFASHGDIPPYHGWVLGFDAATLNPTGVFNATPNGGDGGIWESGGIPALDTGTDGDLYFSTGNGTFDGISNGSGGAFGLDANGFPALGNYGDCIVKLASDATTSASNQNINGWGFKVVDYYSPPDTQYLNENDFDLGSGGILILPDSAGSTAHPHLLAGGGKDGKLYLIDRDAMGKFNAVVDTSVQTFPEAYDEGCFSTPAWFNGNLYCVGAGSTARVYPVSNATVATTPLSQSKENFIYSGATPTISASGTSNALVWVIDWWASTLRVYDAQNLAKEYWTSNSAPNHKDKLARTVKFTTPTVADGSVFVGTANAVYAYSHRP